MSLYDRPIWQAMLIIYGGLALALFITWFTIKGINHYFDMQQYNLCVQSGVDDGALAQNSDTYSHCYQSVFGDPFDNL